MKVDDSEILKVINWVERAQSYCNYLRDRFDTRDPDNTWSCYFERRHIESFDYYGLPTKRPIVTSIEAVFDFKPCNSLLNFYLFGSKKMFLYFESKKFRTLSQLEFYGYRELLHAIYEFRQAAESFPKFKDVFYQCTPLFDLPNGDLVFLERQENSKTEPVSLFLHETQELVRLAPDFWSFLLESEKAHYFPTGLWMDYLDPNTGFFSADLIDPAIFEPIADFKPIEVTKEVPRHWA